MDKEQIITRITDCGIVAVVRADSVLQAKRITEACLEGGVAAIEMTFTVPFAHKLIEEVATSYGPEEIILGAGTVLDAETARIAILSGANYIVSPHFDPEVVKLCNRYRIAVMPGAMTIKEVVTAMEAGADIVKVFPGEAFGPKMLTAIHGPLPQAKLMPTGGVSIENVHQWIEAGAVAVGAGGALTGGAKTGDFSDITQKAKEFISKIKEARKNG